MKMSSWKVSQEKQKKGKALALATSAKSQSIQTTSPEIEE